MRVGKIGSGLTNGPGRTVAGLGVKTTGYPSYWTHALYMGYMSLSAETRVKQRPVGFASSEFLAMVLDAFWSRRWRLSFSVHALARCILEDVGQTQVCPTAGSES